MTAALATAVATDDDRPHAPWCTPDCDGLIHETATAVLDTVDIDGAATTVSIGVQVDNSTGRALAVLRVQRADRPTFLTGADVDRLTAGMSADTCRQIAAELMAGMFADQLVVIPAEHLTGFAKAALAAQDYTQAAV